MTYGVSPVVPASIERCKRIAKQLHKYFPDKTLAACQATTAQLFFQKNWHRLEVAANSGATPGAFDHQLNDMDDRYEQQINVVYETLGGLDRGIKHSRLSAQSSSEVALIRDRFGYLLRNVGPIEPRLEMAFGRWMNLYSVDLVTYLAPTAEKAPPMSVYDDTFSVYEESVYAQLPAKLAQWWRRNVPQHADAAATLEELQHEPNTLSLLRVGLRWGRLCMRYADCVNETMTQGPAYLLSERYAAYSAQDYVRPTDPATVHPSLLVVTKPWLSSILDGVKEDINNYLLAYPRDDLYYQHLVNPAQFVSAAHYALDALGLPHGGSGSRRALDSLTR